MVPELLGHVLDGVPAVLAGVAVWSIGAVPGQLVRLILGVKALKKAKAADVPAVMDALARWESGPKTVRAELGSEPPESQSQE
ncbi:hypothetical protein ACFYOK_35475 [Microbispora bryophytorum]|uniref:hypothetical protein n=1 Tax=Microbispora bryophytorum TaxID=1460882 RepID=UPI0033DA98CA